jgi:hypothetical protein
MPVMTRLLGVVVPSALALSVVAFGVHRTVVAADHFDPPARVGLVVGQTIDVAADIADLYAFHDANNVYIALSFAGPSDPQLPAFYDRNVLYTINVSNAGSRTDTEIPIEIRFGFDGIFPGIQVTGLPGGTVRGPVETNVTTANGIVIRAGLFDDPFFFDQQGFIETRQTGTLAFRNNRTPFHGRNDTFVVFSVPRPLIDRGQPLDIWATTARIGG